MTTKLDCLNHMMGVVGESPVSSAESNHPSAISARVVLDSVDLEFQRKAWWFNTDLGIKLLPNEQGEIIVPSDLVRFRTTAGTRYVQRGGKLYDRVSHTANIGQAITADLTLRLDISDLPEAAALYIKHKAAYDFYLHEDGDETKSTRLLNEANMAWVAITNEQLEAEDVNSNDRPISRALKARLDSGYAPSGRIGRFY